MSLLEDQLGYRFKKTALLTAALTHPSLQGTGVRVEDYERLELLGDAVLSLVITEMLLERFAEEPEGDIVKRRAALVNGRVLAEVADAMNLGAFLRLSESEEASGGRSNKRNLENAVEALIGAIYTDGGMEIARQFIVLRFAARISDMQAPPQDAKTGLQEWAQGRGLPLPVYALVEQSGPSHAPSFIVSVAVEGHSPAQAQAGNKREAERQAAELLLAQVKK